MIFDLSDGTVPTSDRHPDQDSHAPGRHADGHGRRPHADPNERSDPGPRPDPGTRCGTMVPVNQRSPFETETRGEDGTQAQTEAPDGTQVRYHNRCRTTLAPYHGPPWHRTIPPWYLVPTVPPGSRCPPRRRPARRRAATSRRRPPPTTRPRYTSGPNLAPYETSLPYPVPISF